MVMDNKKYEAAKTLLRADLRLSKEPQEGDVARLLLAAPGHRRRGLAGDWPHLMYLTQDLHNPTADFEAESSFKTQPDMKYMRQPLMLM